MSDDTVRVAVRIRPLVTAEIEKGCDKCIALVPGQQQIQIRGTEKSFTFNHVFGEDVDHETFYETAIKQMVNKIFKGYNVTILAYGQTGSGKTFSMGTNYAGEESMGVIPRAVYDIFHMMEAKQDHSFKVAVSFMELYQEQLYDLLADKQRTERIVDIREDVKGIKIIGLTEIEVTTAQQTLQCLLQGSMERATGATAMNAQSSRSHAVFTIVINQAKKNDPNGVTTSKFHLVDLAGSERSKKTQATGERFKEGVNINKGLLALGNVISQLGEGGSASYIGYRDSKLTRLLQDSLGGNSMTLMIACVSPADYNLDETLSTLRYADRARKIKNKPIVNQDPKAAELNRLNALVQELRSAIVGQGTVASSCPPEHAELQEKNRDLQKKFWELTDKLNSNFIALVKMHEREELAEKARDDLKSAIAKIIEEFEEVLANPNVSIDVRSAIEPIYKKMLELENDQKKTAEEMLQHELGPASTSIGKPVENDDAASVSVDGDPIEASDDEVRDDLDEKHAEHTLRQAEWCNEIQTINHGLAMKEELISTLLKNSSQIAEHSKELQEMENEIKTLQIEKEELSKALQNQQSNNATAKLAQSRRLKVQELEKKINDLTKKCTEQMRIIKMKEKSDHQIKNLSAEISSLKQKRVRMIREMRKESERFNQWKRASERELMRLKNQDRKRQNEMAKLQTQHNKQQNVFRRKMEEANAINKRLKEAMELQQKAQQRREKHANSKESGIQSWVQRELAVLVSTVDAECSIEKLQQDRAILEKELEDLKKNGCETPEAQAQAVELKEYIDLRNVQIAGLQEQIVESDQASRANTRWNVIQSMNDAKAALKVLFEAMAADRKKNYATIQEMNELMEKYDAALMKNRQYELREKSHAHDARRIGHLESKLESCRRQPETPDGQRIDELEKELEAYKEKSERLEEQLSIAENFSTSMERKKAKVAPRVRALMETNDNSFLHISDDSFTDDDLERDPDWIKTPRPSRMQKHSNSEKNTSTESQNSLKRSLTGSVKCSCKTKCISRLCSCVKNRVNCIDCNCSDELCQNRDKKNAERDLFTDVTTTQEFEHEEEPTKRARLDA